MNPPGNASWNEVKPAFHAFLARCARQLEKSGTWMLAGGLLALAFDFLFLSVLVAGFLDKMEYVPFGFAFVPVAFVLGLLGTFLLIVTYKPERFEELSVLGDKFKPALFIPLIISLLYPVWIWERD